MTIITSFLSPYVVKFGWKIGDRFKNGITEQKEKEEEDDYDSQRITFYCVIIWSMKISFHYFEKSFVIEPSN
jgi:hypothetical protein